MNRIDRLSAILIILQSKRIVKAQEIAEKFEVSMRTIYRDMLALGEAGVPIRSEAGIGYSLMEGYTLPPVMLTRDEAGAILTAGKVFDKYAGNYMKTQFDSALAKIKAVLKTLDKDYLENLDGKISSISFDKPAAGEGSTLALLETALAGNRVVFIEYFSNSSHETTSREIEPMGVFFYSGSWHMIAYCRLRKGFRQFRLDRIKSVHLRDETFNPDKFKSIDKILQDSFEGIALHKVIIRFKKNSRYSEFKNRIIFGFQQEKELDGKVELTFLVDSLPFICRWLINFGNEAEIISPQELKDLMKKLLSELSSHYLKE